jgi:hypothetical protein
LLVINNCTRTNEATLYFFILSSRITPNLRSFFFTIRCSAYGPHSIFYPGPKKRHSGVDSSTIFYSASFSERRNSNDNKMIKKFSRARLPKLKWPSRVTLAQYKQKPNSIFKNYQLTGHVSLPEASPAHI